MAKGGRLKKLGSETAVYGLSSMVGRLINVLLVPFYANVFAPSEYGVVATIYTAFAFLNILYTHGTESAYLKFASGSESDTERQRIFSTVVGSLFLSSLAFSGIILFFQTQTSALMGLDAKWVNLLWYAAGILIFDTLSSIPFAELRLQNRPIRFAVIRLGSIAVNIALNIILIFGFDMGIEAILIAGLCSSGANLILLTPVYWQRLRLMWSRETWQMVMKFGLPFLPGGLGYVLAERVNIFFLENMPAEDVIRLYGESMDTAQMAALALIEGETVYGNWAVGVFNACAKLGVFMMLVVQMFRFAWQPFFLQHAKDEDAQSLFATVFTIFSAGGAFIFLAVSFFAAEIVSFPLGNGRFLIPETYWAGLSVVPIMLLAYYFQGWYYVFSAGAYIHKKTKYFIHCTLAGSAVSLFLNVFFVNQYGMVAAATATTSAYLVMALMLFLIVRRFYAVPYEWGKVSMIVSFTTLFFVVWIEIPILQIWWIEGLMLIAFLISLILTKVIPAGQLNVFRKA